MKLVALNSAQRRAVETTDGPLLVLAGAGTGKTSVVTHRIANLLRKGVPASRVLAVTFTNKAAAEMRDRVRALVPKADLAGMVISTFHSLGVRLLRADAPRLGWKTNFTIYDESDQISLLRGVLRELRLGEIEAPIKRIRWLVSDGKNRLVEPDDTAASLATRRYDEALRRRNAVDFDDLIRLPVRLLETSPDVVAKWRERFHYLLVDEYQDTNAAQYALVKLLSGERRNVCVVGDDDQSIYGWRGADVGKILRFERDFPGAKVVTLEENYRSTGTILQAANALIQRNVGRREKRLRSSLGPGEPIDLYVATDEVDEASFVAQRIEGILREGRTRPSEIAVLYRQNTQSKLFEDALRERKIPYRVVGGQSFYDRKEIRDVIAYLKLIANDDDEISLRRVVNDPPRGIGATTLERIDAHGLERGLTLCAALGDARAIPDLTARASDAAVEFFALLGRLRAIAATSPPSRVLDALFDEVPLRAAIETSSDDPLDAEMRWNEILSLRDVASRFEASNRDARLPSFLEQMALVTEEDDDRDDARDAVTLLTLHAAKGLEFDVVFVVGLEDGVLPHRRSTEPGEDALDDRVDEERRLLYVGITRARKNLTITRAAARTQRRRPVECIPSRFLAEIDRDCLREVKRNTAPTSPEDSRQRLRELMARFDRGPSETSPAPNRESPL